MTQMRIKLIPLTSTAAAAVVAGYTAFGSPLPNPVSKLMILSTLDQDVFVSDDGVNDKLYIPKGSVTPYFLDITAGDIQSETEANFARGVQLFVKRAVGVPAAGSIILMGAFVNQL